MDMEELRSQRQQLRHHFKRMYPPVRTQSYSTRLINLIARMSDRTKHEQYVAGLMADMYSLGALRERLGKHTDNHEEN